MNAKPEEMTQAGQANRDQLPRPIRERLVLYPTVEWLTFDIIGTVFDVVGSLTSGMAPIAQAMNVHPNYAAFAYNWYENYGGGVGAVESGQHPWTDPDTIIQEGFLGEWQAEGLPAISAANTTKFCDLWRAANAWPDCLPGFTRLHKRFHLSTLSNSALDQQTALKAHSNLPFDHLLSGATIKAFKPNPAVYKMALSVLNIKPNQVMMVAAHKYDVAAAKALGFHTAFVTRPNELGPNHHPDTTPDPSVDINATSMEDLVSKLGL